MKGKFTAVLFILLFILIAAVVFTVLTALDRGGSPLPAPTPETVSVPTAEPQTTPFPAPVNTPVPTPVVTAVPTPAATLAPAPVITVQEPQPTTAPAAPAATPTPLPTTVPFQTMTQSTIGGGSFRSDTGTALNIVADWSAVTLNENQVQVTVTVYAVSYMLFTQSLSNAVNISLDGQYVSLDAPAINYDGSTQISTQLASYRFTVDMPLNSSRSMTLQVEWHFNGSYGGTELAVLECGGILNLSR